jgi:hypothetical protein
LLTLDEPALAKAGRWVLVSRLAGELAAKTVARLELGESRCADDHNDPVVHAGFDECGATISLTSPET